MSTTPTPAPHPSVEALREMLDTELRITAGEVEPIEGDCWRSEKLAAAYTELSALLSRLDVLHEENAALKREIATRENLIVAADSRLDVLRAENEALRETLGAAKAHIEQLCDDECPAVERDAEYDRCPVLCLIDEALTAAPRAQERDEHV